MPEAAMRTHELVSDESLLRMVVGFETLDNEEKQEPIADPNPRADSVEEPYPSSDSQSSSVVASTVAVGESVANTEESAQSSSENQSSLVENSNSPSNNSSQHAPGSPEQKTDSDLLSIEIKPRMIKKRTRRALSPIDLQHFIVWLLGVDCLPPKWVFVRNRGIITGLSFIQLSDLTSRMTRTLKKIAKEKRLIGLLSLFAGDDLTPRNSASTPPSEELLRERCEQAEARDGSIPMIIRYRKFQQYPKWFHFRTLTKVYLNDIRGLDPSIFGARFARKNKDGVRKDWERQGYNYENKTRKRTLSESAETDESAMGDTSLTVSALQSYHSNLKRRLNHERVGGPPNSMIGNRDAPIRQRTVTMGALANAPSVATEFLRRFGRVAETAQEAREVNIRRKKRKLESKLSSDKINSITRRMDEFMKSKPDPNVLDCSSESVSQSANGADLKNLCLTLESMIEAGYPFDFIDEEKKQSDQEEKEEKDGQQSSNEPSTSDVSSTVPSTVASSKITPLSLNDLFEKGKLLTLPDFDSSVSEHSRVDCVAVDCEMVTTEFNQECASICIVDFHTRECLYFAYVKPLGEIKNYNTRYSGITPDMLSEEDCQHSHPIKQSVLEVFEDMVIKLGMHRQTILIGHGLENDLSAMKLSHCFCIDTSLIFKPGAGGRFKHKLKYLAQVYLDRRIQCSLGTGHDPKEDALAALDLIRLRIEPGFEDVTSHSRDRNGRVSSNHLGLFEIANQMYCKVEVLSDQQQSFAHYVRKSPVGITNCFSTSDCLIRGRKFFSSEDDRRPFVYMYSTLNYKSLEHTANVLNDYILGMPHNSVVFLVSGRRSSDLARVKEAHRDRAHAMIDRQSGRDQSELRDFNSLNQDVREAEEQANGFPFWCLVRNR